jgi:hypothetical protein
MSDDDPELRPEMWVTEIVGDGPETGAVMSRTPVNAGDLNQSHVGKLVSCYDPDAGMNYGATILKIVHFPNGKIPLVSVWIRHPLLPRGDKPERDERTDLPLDYELNLIEQLAW